MDPWRVRVGQYRLRVFPKVFWRRLTKNDSSVFVSRVLRWIESGLSTCTFPVPGPRTTLIEVGRSILLLGLTHRNFFHLPSGEVPFFGLTDCPL